MDDLLAKAGAIVLESGINGVVILAQAYVILTLYRRVNELQERRFTDAREIITTLAANNTVMERLSEAVKTSINLRGRVE